MKNFRWHLYVHRSLLPVGIMATQELVDRTIDCFKDVEHIIISIVQAQKDWTAIRFESEHMSRFPFFTLAKQWFDSSQLDSKKFNTR